MPSGRPPRETITQRRERRAAVDDLELVLEAAARFLESRSRSVAEVRRRLTDAGYRPALVDQAVARLEEMGFLDDTAFARAWVESRDRARPRGEHALRRELRLKGVDQALIDGVLAARRGEATSDLDQLVHSSPDPDLDAARRLLERRRASLEREPDLRLRRQRAYALLARSGFAPEVCGDIARSFVADAGFDSPGD